MRHIILFVVLISAVFSATAQQPQLTREKLATDTVIQTYPCAKEYAWFYQDGALNRCTVSRDTRFGQAQIPTGSIIELWPNGTTRYVMLAHNAVVLGYNVMGGSFLGPSEGSVLTFYPSGKLRSVYLVDDQTIQGVPCRGDQWGILTDPIDGGNQVEFYEDGKLRSCKLTRDYAGQQSGHRLTLASEPLTDAAPQPQVTAVMHSEGDTTFVTLRMCRPRLNILLIQSSKSAPVRGA